ncbi:M20 family metallopeptidase [Aminipila butyrica]|uniref:Peptidase M20 domain-containing protein 2 n=1 Tax=Aminipila butyrica TaxID=433296 RepID=A0A858BSH6_9FIRM|nr:M20 family metallopeptidase [Aminipila butyrica]QIB67900.1 M20 family metallopeptidase [Aminipila butyrica]
MERQETQVKSVLKQLEEQIAEISDYIFEHPELGDEEYQSVAYLTKLLRDQGFQVECPYKGLETAFRAEFGDDNAPRIAFLAEYDALPGYGPEKKPAHACGHNWIAATTVGAGLALAKLKDSFKGKVVVIGTPAEETTGRKIDLANSGAFDDIDAAFQMHLYENSNLRGRALAMDSVEFEFIGKASHAAVHPYEGINALDAVQLTFNGISFLRQQLKSDVRIHGIITEGGEAPNTIPNHCKCLFYVRAAKKSYFQEVFEKVKNCGRGAALMTGTELKINQYENAYDDLIINPVLADIAAKYMEQAGFEALSQEDEVPGSTDIGNVSYCCPTLYGNVGIADGKVKVHEEDFLEHANGSEAKKRMMMTVETFVRSALELYSDADLRKRVREAFEKAIEE